MNWQLRTHDEKMRLKTARALSEKALQEKLQKQQLALEQELALLKTKHKAELTMLRIKNKQDISDYREYLDSLDQLKISITHKYRHLPEALAFTIHHHAKHLLNQMWEADDLQQKINSELQLIQFMTSINEDIRSAPASGSADLLPLKTLELLNK
nr:hypothetical protein [Methylomarinum sp. Ch1-1]MDP4523016.1 hypothetical protein [Methylomarinum sp. Ch1-1]